MASHRLLTIPQSHYCEKARWALQRAGIPFVEEGHAPVFQIPHAWWAGRRRTVPVLVLADGAVLNDSSDILSYADSFAAEPLLFDLDNDNRAFLARLDDRFGPHSRRISYAAILPEVQAVLPSLLPSLPRIEQLMVRRTLPVTRWVLRKAMAITPASVERSRRIVDEIFGEVAQLLADGRSFLQGPRFGALDLTFCALAGPLLAPPQYGGPVPGYEELPSQWRELVDSYRATPAGRWALKVYEEQRNLIAAVV